MLLIRVCESSRAAAVGIEDICTVMTIIGFYDLTILFDVNLTYHFSGGKLGRP